MFSLYKTVEFLICKLSTVYKFSLGHEDEVTILRLLQDISNFKESAEIKYKRWLKNITSNFEFQRSLFNFLNYIPERIPQIFNESNYSSVI